MPVIWPAIVEAAEPVTRFRMADEAEGWAKCTVFGWPTEKPCQLTIARCEPWFTVIDGPELKAICLVVGARIADPEHPNLGDIPEPDDDVAIDREAKRNIGIIQRGHAGQHL